MITSITLAEVPVAEVVDANTIPGWAVSLFKDLACMHDPTVRNWIRLYRAPGRTVIVAEDSWRDNGRSACETLTFPISERDAEALARILAELEADQ